MSEKGKPENVVPPPPPPKKGGKKPSKSDLSSPHWEDAVRRLHHDVPPARVHVWDLGHGRPEVEVAPPAVPDARVPEALRDAACRSGGRGGEKGDDERAPGLAKDDCREEAREEEDRDEGGATGLVFWLLL